MRGGFWRWLLGRFYQPEMERIQQENASLELTRQIQRDLQRRADRLQVEVEAMRRRRRRR